MSKESLKKAVALTGGQVALAAAIRGELPGVKVSQGHVWKWLNRASRPMPPAEYVIAIARATGFAVTPHQLRQDIYPRERDGMPEQDFAA